MRCEDAAARAAESLTGALADADRAALVQHLATCARCREEYDTLRRTWQLLGEVPSPAPEPLDVRDRFDAALSGHLQRAGSPRRWLSRYGGLAAAAAAALVVGLAAGRMTAASPRPVDTDVAALRQELREMRIMVGLSLMQQSSASARLQGVSWSERIDQPGDELITALLETLMHDPNDNVRLAAVDALRRVADRDAVRRGARDALPRQTSPLVQIALIDFAVESRDRAAADVLRRVAADPSVNDAVRTRAARAAQELG
jgi:hypothetical protein